MDQEYHEDSLRDDYEYKHTPIINRIYVMADVQDLVCVYAHVYTGIHSEGRMRRIVSVSTESTVARGSHQFVPYPFKDMSRRSKGPQQGMWVLTFGRRLHTTPLSPNITSILDVGTGTGLWANAIAHAFPIAEVIATDLVPPSRQDDTAPNVHYIQHDADDPEWALFQVGQFDYIHARMVTGEIHDWPGFRKKCFRHLKPGGALEIIDMSYPLRADKDAYDSEDTSALVKVVQLPGERLAQDGLDYQVSGKQTAGLEEAGFEDVEEEIYRCPIGAWPEDDQEKKLGLLAQRNMDRFLSLSGRHVLTHKGFLSLEDITRVIDAAKEELLKTDERRYFSIMYVLYCKLLPPIAWEQNMY